VSRRLRYELSQTRPATVASSAAPRTALAAPAKRPRAPPGGRQLPSPRHGGSHVQLLEEAEAGNMAPALAVPAQVREQRVPAAIVQERDLADHLDPRAVEAVDQHRRAAGLAAGTNQALSSTPSAERSAIDW